MKIRVQHGDGRIETLTIKGRLRVSEGRELDRIHTETGMEHYFTKDGHYDGWGGNVSDPQRAMEIREEVEARRDIEGVQRPAHPRIL
ncbi:MAG: hypothetical protein WB799_20150 [Candidatus Sulfotelmatobacter sp.]